MLLPSINTGDFVLKKIRKELKSMTQEELESALYDKLSVENEVFIKDLSAHDSHYCIENAYR